MEINKMALVWVPVDGLVFYGSSDGRVQISGTGQEGYIAMGRRDNSLCICVGAKNEHEAFATFVMSLATTAEKVSAIYLRLGNAMNQTSLHAHGLVACFGEVMYIAKKSGIEFTDQQWLTILETFGYTPGIFLRSVKDFKVVNAISMRTILEFAARLEQHLAAQECF